ncbi:hypothetical protein C3495_03815 [Clostridiaceae bacterium 14S0207]|nr:hypothetical protein C3495_03815 [Clostridiaceae bacterium 14S0207]
MKKPDIFSKDYEKKMQQFKRRKIIYSVLVIILVFLIVMSFFDNSYIGRYVKIRINKTKNLFISSNNDNNKEEKLQSKIEVKEKTTEEKLKEEKESNKLEKEIKKKEENQIEKFNIQLKPQVEISGEIQKEDNKNKFIKSLNIKEGMSYELVEDKKSALIFIPKTSEMFLINVKKEVEDISNNIFYTKNKMKIERKVKLSQDQSFIWAEKPQLYKNKVFYLSKLPNLNNNNKYFVWIYDIKSKQHKCIYDNRIRGNGVEFGEKTSKGIQVILDGKLYYLNEDGKVI